MVQKLGLMDPPAPAEQGDKEQCESQTVETPRDRLLQIYWMNS